MLPASAVTYRTDSISLSISHTVVLPLVPVTAATGFLLRSAPTANSPSTGILREKHSWSGGMPGLTTMSSADASPAG